jgi:hypothetical protein
LKSYTPCFASILQKPVYFDHKRDELLLGSSQALRGFTCKIALSETQDQQKEEKINFLSLNIFSGFSRQRPRGEIEDFYDVLSRVFEAQARLEYLVSKFNIPQRLTILVPEGRQRSIRLFVSTFMSLFKDQREPELWNLGGAFACALGNSKRHTTILAYGLSDDSMSMVETLSKRVQD